MSQEPKRVFSCWPRVAQRTGNEAGLSRKVAVLVAGLAAFSLARMKFWGSATLATGVFLAYLIPDTLVFIPLFKTFAFIHDKTGLELINHWWVLIILLPTLTVPFCHG